MLLVGEDWAGDKGLSERISLLLIIDRSYRGRSVLEGLQCLHIHTYK